MSTAAAAIIAPVEHRHPRSEPVIARRAFRQIWIGATVCGVLFGATAASSALSYVAAFPTVAARQEVAATMSGDAGMAILLGPVNALDTVGGYTIYKGFAFLTTIGAIWALFATNRLLRGEEDSGRWQLVLAGNTRAWRATAATLLAVAVAVAEIFVIATVLMLLVGRNPDVGFGTGETVLYGLSIVVPPAVFVAVGALASQLRPTRRSANGLGLVLVGIAFVVRMLADSSPGLNWLRWATPFGWTELMEPFTTNNGWPLLPAVVTILVLGAASIALAASRDAGSAVLASSDISPMRPLGTGSAFGLAVRLERPSVVSWCVGAASAGMTLGIIAKITMSATVPASISDMLDKFGVQGGFVMQYLGVAFLLVGTTVALLPASQIGAAADEQTSGRLAQVLASPTPRVSWFVGRLALAAVTCLAAGVLAGVGAWVGATTQGVDLDFVSMVVAGVNVVPTALLVLGFGAVVFAVAPRAAAPCVYALVVWSLLVDLLASMITSVSWLEHASLFHYMALAPATDPDPVTLVTTTAIAVALGGVGTALFHRRDIQS